MRRCETCQTRSAEVHQYDHTGWRRLCLFCDDRWTIGVPVCWTPGQARASLRQELDAVHTWDFGDGVVGWPEQEAELTAAIAALPLRW